MYTNVIVSKGKYDTDSHECIERCIRNICRRKFDTSEILMKKYNFTCIKYFTSHKEEFSEERVRETSDDIFPLVFLYVKKGLCKLEWVLDSVYHEAKDLSGVYDRKYKTSELLVEEKQYIFLNPFVKYQVSSACKDDCVVIHERSLRSLDAILPSPKRKKTCDHGVAKPEFCPISSESLSKLRPGHKLNDEIVDRYSMILNERNYASRCLLVFRCDTFRTYHKRGMFPSYNFQRWFPIPYGESYDMNRLPFKYYVMPINIHDGHWTMAILDMSQSNHSVTFYDSYYKGCKLHERIKRFYVDLKRQLHIANVRINDVALNTYAGPKQSNGVDCGVFMIMCIEHMFKHKNLSGFDRTPHDGIAITETREKILRRIQ